MSKKLLILTPDGVGSTLLQRAMCIFGNINEKWINPHELTNGLIYDSDLLCKDYSLGYTQSLVEIVDLLERNNNNLIVRLAHYHLINRKDLENELKYFYQYLNNNFIIISCHRKNILEYAMSWAIRDLKNTLNVYSFQEKFVVHPETDRFTLDIEFIDKKLNDYQNYIFWLNDNFKHVVNFYYEDINTIDSFISSILEYEPTTFSNKFNIKISDYCLLSSKNKQELKSYKKTTLMSLVAIKIFSQNLVNKKFMINGMPLKMNNFNNKISKCLNFNEVLQTYNIWASNTNNYNFLSLDDIKKFKNDDYFNI